MRRKTRREIGETVSAMKKWSADGRRRENATASGSESGNGRGRGNGKENGRSSEKELGQGQGLVLEDGHVADVQHPGTTQGIVTGLVTGIVVPYLFIWIISGSIQSAVCLTGQLSCLKNTGMETGRGSADFRWRKKMSAPKNKMVRSN